jgi:hypothetical protein
MFFYRIPYHVESATQATPSQRAQAKQRRSSRKRLRFEHLESRRVLASVVSLSPAFEGGIVRVGTSSLAITYSEPVLGGNVATNFELRHQGPDGILGNTDDSLISLIPTYSGNTTTLNFSALTEGVYRFTARDSITTVTGTALDGDNNGQAGGNKLQDFVVDALASEPATSLTPFPGVGQYRSGFGQAIAADGGRRVVGAPNVRVGNNENVGAVYVFDATGEVLMSIANPSRNGRDLFGYFVAVSGDKIVVGAPTYHYPGGPPSSGIAYVFNANTGGLIATLEDPDPTGDSFGGDVAIDGNTIVIGATQDEVGGNA